MKIYMLYMTLDKGSRFLIQRLLEGAPIDIRVGDLFSPIVLTRDPNVEQELEPANIETPRAIAAQMTGIDFLYSSATAESTATISLDSPELVAYQRTMIDKYKGVASLHEPLGENAAPFLTLCRGGSLSGNQRRWLSTMSTTLASQPPVVLCEPRVQLRAV